MITVMCFLNIVLNHLINWFLRSVDFHHDFHLPQSGNAEGVGVFICGALPALRAEDPTMGREEPPR